MLLLYLLFLIHKYKETEQHIFFLNKTKTIQTKKRKGAVLLQLIPAVASMVGKTNFIFVVFVLWWFFLLWLVVSQQYEMLVGQPEKITRCIFC